MDKLTTKEQILLALSISLGALFLATLITLIVARYSKKIHEFCLMYLPCFRDEPQKDDTNDNFFKSVDDKIPLMLSGKGKNDFIIPGTMYFEKIQPDTKKVPRTREGSDIRSRGDSASDDNAKTEDNLAEALRKPRRGILGYKRSKSIDVASTQSRPRMLSGTFANEYSESAAGKHSLSLDSHRAKRGSYQIADLNPSILRRNALSNSEGHLIHQQTDREDHEDGSISIQRSNLPIINNHSIDSEEEADQIASLPELRPELYDMSRKKSVGIGALGKIKISLHYIDQDRNKLELFIHGMDHLQLRPSDTGLYTNIILIPERENILKSKIFPASTNPVFQQSFVFRKLLSTENFNTKTIRFTIYTLNGQDKTSIYGESSISLARSEIFGQVKTDNVLNIKPPSHTNEIGDILLDILYTKSDSLHVFVRTIKLAPTTSVDYMSALQVKVSIKRRRRKIGDTLTVLCPLRKENGLNVPVNSETKQTIPRENFLQYSLHITVTGKHKLLGTSTRIGRKILGEDTFSEADSMHWTAIFNSPGIQYSLWHVLYSN